MRGRIDPLRDRIERFIDFDAVRDGELALLLGATNVETGRLCIIPREKVSADVVMASAARRAAENRFEFRHWRMCARPDFC